CLDQATESDLSSAREVLTPHRRYTRLQAGNPDRQWVTVNFSTAWKITQGWASTAPGPFALHRGPWFPVLRQRWRARAEKLSIPALAPPLVTLHDAVALH